jgi:hypothetical protein
MIFQMPSLQLLIEKHGQKKGRRLYNAFHKGYRKRNAKKLAKYARDRRAAQKASNNAPSEPSQVIPSSA